MIAREPISSKIDEICVVITADCDISKNKFGRHLACLRIIGLDSYVRDVWAEKKLKRLREDEAEKLRAQVAKWHTRLTGSQSQLTTDAVIAWIRRDTPEVISQYLQVPEDELKKFHAALSMSRGALIALDDAAENDTLAKYVTYKSAITKQNFHLCRQAAVKQAQSETIPDDIFLLPSLPQIQELAAVIMLREVFGIAYDAVCYRSTDATTRDKYLRVGRLNPTFKYAVSQAFGSLYSRIGLPTEYETRCRDAIQNISNYTWE